MADFNKTLWTFAFSIIGISFGWFLNQAGQWFRTRIEDKKKLNQVLFNLLEVYFQIQRSDIEKYIKKVTDKLLEKIPIEVQTEEVKQQIINGIATVLETSLKPKILEELKIVAEN